MPTPLFFRRTVYLSLTTFKPTKSKEFNIPPPEFHNGRLDHFGLHVRKTLFSLVHDFSWRESYCMLCSIRLDTVILVCSVSEG